MNPGTLRREICPSHSALAILCSRDLTQNSEIAELSTRV